MKFARTLVLLGCVLFVGAFTMPPYKDQSLFMERYMAMGVGQSEAYWKLRDEMLTPRYQLQDYGITLASIGIAGLFFLRKRPGTVSAPRRRSTLIGIAIVAAFAAVSGYVFDLSLAFTWGEFPHWADSMAIPLMGVPFQLFLLLAWAAIHMLFLLGRYQPSAPLALAYSRDASLWLLFVSAVTVAACAIALALGQYYYAVPAALWVYLYLCLAAGRRAGHDTQP